MLMDIPESWDPYVTIGYYLGKDGKPVICDGICVSVNAPESVKKEAMDINEFLQATGSSWLIKFV